MQPDVHRRGLDRVLVERVDADAPGGERLADRAVGEDHGGSRSRGSREARGTLAGRRCPRPRRGRAGAGAPRGEPHRDGTVGPVRERAGRGATRSTRVRARSVVGAVVAAALVAVAAGPAAAGDGVADPAGRRGAGEPIAVTGAAVDVADVAELGPDDHGPYAATIRRTAFGIPHVLADDYGDLGFGYGYAFAEDNLCTAADFYVTVNGDRSRFFGPDGRWAFRGNGTTHRNLDSDAYFRAVNAGGRIEELLAEDPPHGPRPEIVDAVRGYAAGYNRYLEVIGGADGVRDPACAGEPWVRPITEIDVYRRFYQLAGLGSVGAAIEFIGSAQPPHPPLLGSTGQAVDGEATADGEAAAAPAADELAPFLELLDDGPLDLEALAAVPGVSDEQLAAVAAFPARNEGLLGVGSNAYGFGREATADGTGLVLGNPHFPWEGGERLYHAHLTIPGEFDVQGASLLGVPVVLIGTTEGLAWSHTVSTAYRFTPFQLTLVPGSPTTYLVDGEPREMEAREVTVPVRRDDGSVDEVTRTLYWTEYGPMFTGVLGLPLFPWTPVLGFAMGDANDQMRYLNHFFEKNLAQSVDELAEVTARNQGVPWVNTIAADRQGDAYYADVSVVPNVPDAKVLACPTALGIVTFAALGLPTLDGSRSSCAWDVDDDAVVPGIFGPGNLPSLVRDDYVHNGNDSYWLSHLDDRLEGFARIVGDEGTMRTLRTRSGLQMVLDRAAGTDGHTDLHPDRWTREILERVVFDNRQPYGELVRDDVVAVCRTLPVAPSTSQLLVELGEACDVLAAWDLRDDLDSDGAVLWRRFQENLLTIPVVGDPTGTGLLDLPYTRPFSTADPVGTPSGLNPLDPRVALALGTAVSDLRAAGIPLDAPLRGWQYEDRGDGERIPIHGGPGGLGIFNAIGVVWDGDPADGQVGYPGVPHGSSFVMVATWDEDADCPVDASALVTYGQSDDVTSPHLGDQTREFSAKRFVPMRWCEEDILADPELTVTEVASAPRPGQAAEADDEVDADDEVGTDDERHAQRVAGAPARSPLPATGQTLAGVLGLALLGAGLLLVRRRR
ncbi:LPXTG cell wall anchor domain-containing protein [Nitriliruptoraceae bacterium ZYF776]|nr:LPXTG cell wall anchor domain-containing protein [Profundirhabdus halotolerans]